MKGFRTSRLVAGVAAVAAAAITLTACSGSSAGQGGELKLDTSKKVTITATWWGSDTRAELTNEVIQAFEKKYPNITVKGQYKDWTGYWDALATSTAANDSPDVIQMDELYLASYGDKGALLDLNKASDIISTKEFSKDALATGQIGDAQYALPIGISTYAIVANKTLFDKYGVALPDDKTWTWDDLAKIADELTQKSGGAITGAGALGGFDAGSLKYWARMEGGDIFDAKGNVTLKPKALADFWNFQLGLIKSGGSTSASAMVESQAAGITGNDFSTNKVAIGTSYNTQLTAIQAASGDDIRLLQLPNDDSSTKPDSLKPSMYWAVASRSKHPAEAAAFVNFMLNDKTAAGILKTERGITANTELQTYLADSLTPQDQAAIDYANGLKPGPAPALTPNGASDIEKTLARYTQQVLFGQTSPEDGAKAFIKELQGDVDSAK